MPKWLYWRLEVLASSPDEITKIDERLSRPSGRLVDWVAESGAEPADVVADDLRKLLDFRMVQFLGDLNVVRNKARRFTLIGNKQHGLTYDRHLIEVSEEHPKAIFLLDYRDPEAGCAGKRVIRSGEVAREIVDRAEQAQGCDWMLSDVLALVKLRDAKEESRLNALDSGWTPLDIFQPYRAEFFGGIEFGGLWAAWLSGVIAAAETLREQTRERGDGAESRPLGTRA